MNENKGVVKHIKRMKYFIKTTLLMIFSMGLYSCLALVPVDVAMVDNELYFVFEKPYEIQFVEVSVVPEKGKPLYNPNVPIKPLWLLGYDVSVPVKSRKYLELRQIKYGQKFEEFSRVENPVQLQKNIEYLVEINMGGKFAKEVFIITDDNKVIMPHPAFERQKDRTYSPSVDKEGNKTIILEPASK